jgi:hypothetical protein
VCLSVNNVVLFVDTRPVVGRVEAEENKAGCEKLDVLGSSRPLLNDDVAVACVVYVAAVVCTFSVVT